MRTLARRSAVAAAAVLLVAAGAAPAFASGGSDDHGHGRGHKVLLKSHLVGSLTTDATLFGVAPGGKDWTVSRSTAKVRTSGRADIKVRDLVFTDGPNTVPQVSASLFCNGEIADTLGPVPFSAAGNARIKGTFDVPDRCLAPAVLINPATNFAVYIAASGAMS